MYFSAIIIEKESRNSVFDTRFNCLPTMIGSLPHTDPVKACALVNRFLKELPAWPQLPKRIFREDMNAQYSEGFPGVVLRGGSVKIDRSGGFHQALENLYTAFLSNDIKQYPTGKDYAAGLNNILADSGKLAAVKGQVVGPLTWGLSVTDETGKAIIYDDILGDAVPKFLKLKAIWQESQLSRISPKTVMFIDEPYMTAFGSATFTLSRDRVIAMMNEVFQGLRGIKGIHCCANTDWSVLLATNTDIISFDAYNFASSLILYPAEVKDFYQRGGVIAWGIVPNTVHDIERESVASLRDRLESAMSPFTHRGVRFKQLIEQGLVTPSCGLAGLSEELAEQVLALLAELSANIRVKYT